MIIDSHVHIGKWKYPYYYGISNSVKETSAVLRESGVARAIAMPSDRMDNERLLAELRRQGQGKYWLFAWVNPKQSGVMEFLEKRADEIAGIKMHGGLTRIKVTDARYRPFLKFAERNGMPVLCHSGKWQKKSSYKHSFALAAKYPGINFIIAHQGGDTPKLKVEAPKALRKSKLGNVWFDTAATREFWTIKKGVEEIGAGRFLFGSDYPVMHPKMSIEAVKAAGIGKAAEQKVFGENAAMLLKRRPVL